MHYQTRTFFALSISVASAIAVTCMRPVITTPEAKKSTEFITMYKSDDWTLRRKAVQQLSKFNDHESIAVLIAATEDSHSAVVIEALRALRKNKPPQALEKITELAEKAPQSNVRWHAIRTLGYYRDPTSAIILAKGLNDEDWLIREESIKSLLKIDDYSIRFISIPYILQALDDPSINVKLTTIKFLRIKDPRIYVKLSKILIDTKEHQQALIKETLKALKGYELDEQTQEKVIHYITHQNQDIRLAAYNTLLSHQKSVRYQKSTSRKKEIAQ